MLKKTLRTSIPQTPQSLYVPNLSAQGQKFGLSMKKGFILVSVVHGGNFDLIKLLRQIETVTTSTSYSKNRENSER